MNLATFIGTDRRAGGINILVGVLLGFKDLLEAKLVQDPNTSHPGVTRVRGFMDRTETVRSPLSFPEKVAAIIALGRDGEFNLRQVAEELDIDPGAASELVSRLVARGDLLRSKDGRHARFKLPEAK